MPLIDTLQHRRCAPLPLTAGGGAHLTDWRTAVRGGAPAT